MAAGVVIIAWALHVAWIARLARDRGRSIVAWVIAATAASGAGFTLGLYFLNRAAESDTNGLALFAGLSPLLLGIGGLVAVAGVLATRSTHVALRREWKIAAPKHGDGTLAIAHDAIELRWESRTDTIPRAQLRSAVPDGECVRLAWDGGEAVLMPMVAPQTRAGRIRQSELIAKLLSH